MQPDRRLFHVMDGLRGVAALAVVTVHFEEVLKGRGLPSAYLAVDLFFMLSGFVLSHAYAGRLDAGMTALEFTRVRLIRLYPLYALGTAIGLVSAVAALVLGGHEFTGTHLAETVVLSAFMLPSPPLGRVPFLFPLNPVAWSLFYEILINIAFAAFWRWLTVRVLLAVAAASAILLLVLDVQSQGLVRGAWWSDVSFGLVRVAFSFTVGVLLHRIHPRFRMTSAWMVILPPLLIPVFAVGVTGIARVSFDFLAVSVVFPAVVLVGSILDVDVTFEPLFSFLGVTSYAIYAVHYPLLVLAARVFKAIGRDPSRFGAWLEFAFLFGTLAFAWVADRWYDAPVRKRIAALDRRRPRQGSACATPGTS